ncbi:MAG TPA: DUF445 family protein [Syntrophorhabdaceae bacterium]|jgi:uncharacterized membrane-anchored protein YjiN (DUF445 family)
MTTFQSGRKIDEAAQRASLRRMRTLSTCLLVAMAALYAVSRYLEKRYPLFEISRAFSEAAIVGALADWFAVVALFRHPLNLPIPHTAILQRNKDKFGLNLATFIKHNFLAREALERKLGSVDFAGRLGAALADPGNAKAIAARLAEEAGSLAGQFEDEELKRFSVDLMLRNLGKMKIVPLIRDVLSLMVRENRHQDLLTEVLTFTGGAIERNREQIREEAKISQAWWIPDFVDDMIFNKMVSKVEDALLSIHDNPNHEMRRKLNEAVRTFIQDLDRSEGLSRRINAVGSEFFEKPSTRVYFEDIWSGLKSKLMGEISDPSSDLRFHLEKAILFAGRSLIEQASVRQGLNRWVHTSLVNLAEEYADTIISIVSDTVTHWDAVKTSSTIELYVGKDLQWIRINGTVVGGLVGILIYIVSRLF